MFQENTKEGKVFAANAIAKIAIKMNPALAFSGQKWVFSIIYTRKVGGQ